MPENTLPVSLLSLPVPSTAGPGSLLQPAGDGKGQGALDFLELLLPRLEEGNEDGPAPFLPLMPQSVSGQPLNPDGKLLPPGLPEMASTPPAPGVAPSELLLPVRGMEQAALTDPVEFGVNPAAPGAMGDVAPPDDMPARLASSADGKPAMVRYPGQADPAALAPSPMADPLDGSTPRPSPSIHPSPGGQNHLVPQPLGQDSGPTVQLSERLATPQWQEGFGNRVVWMVKDHVQQANLHLNPPDLGPLQVRITVRGDETSLHISAQHGIVRETVEAALPRLREMLADSGLNLVRADVSDQGPGGDPRGHGAPVFSDASPGGMDPNPGGGEPGLVSRDLSGGRGLVDRYV